MIKKYKKTNLFCLIILLGVGFSNLNAVLPFGVVEEPLEDVRDIQRKLGEFEQFIAERIFKEAFWKYFKVKIEAWDANPSTPGVDYILDFSLEPKDVYSGEGKIVITDYYLRLIIIYLKRQKLDHKITHLNLSGNRIRDISPLLDLPNIKFLDLSGNYLSQCQKRQARKKWENKVLLSKNNAN